MDKRKKGCLWAALGLGILIVMVGVAVVGGFGYLVYQQFGLRASFVEPAAASHELDEVRAQFAGQTPRLHVVHEGEEGTLHVDQPATPSTAPLSALHVVAFDPSTHKLVRFTVPFWLLRHLPEGKVQVDGKEVLEHVNTPSGRLTVSDLEALGPGLLIDDKRPGGGQVIVWTE